MAYVQSQPNRGVVIGVVALLHGAAIYALISGFAVDVIETIETIVEARNIPVEPTPPPPEPTATADARVAETPRAPQPKLPLERNNDALVIDLPPLPIPDPLPLPRDPTPLPPSPSPSFAAKAATPIGSPGRWATSEDYPAIALRQEREGTARFRVIIGADGRVQACEILGSSGSAELDRATCSMVTKRARFEPATDAHGARTVGSYINSIRWIIPR